MNHNSLGEFKIGGVIKCLQAEAAAEMDAMLPAILDRASK
jgi:hypothetical protein